VTGVVIRQFGRMSPGERCHVSLAVEASSVVKAEQRGASSDVCPDTVAMFRQFWDAHRACPMLGRRCVAAATGLLACGFASGLRGRVLGRAARRACKPAAGRDMLDCCSA
jgi:hypothetical protein